MSEVRLMSQRGRPPKPKAEKSVRITVTLPPELVKRAKHRAESEPGGMSGLVAKALEVEMRDHDR